MLNKILMSNGYVVIKCCLHRYMHIYLRSVKIDSKNVFQHKHLKKERSQANSSRHFRQIWSVSKSSGKKTEIDTQFYVTATQASRLESSATGEEGIGWGWGMQVWKQSFVSIWYCNFHLRVPIGASLWEMGVELPGSQVSAAIFRVIVTEK